MYGSDEVHNTADEIPMSRYRCQYIDTLMARYQTSSYRVGVTLPMTRYRRDTDDDVPMTRYRILLVPLSGYRRRDVDDEISMSMYHLFLAAIGPRAVTARCSQRCSRKKYCKMQNAQKQFRFGLRNEQPLDAQR